MLIGRDYQVESVKAIYKFFQDHPDPKENPIVAMPTGTGKSVSIALFLESIFRIFGGQRIMSLTHVQELVEQNYKKLLEAWPFAPAGIYSSGLRRKDTHQPIIFGGIASVIKNPAGFGKIDLLIIDECHLLSPIETTMYRKLIDFLRAQNPFLRVVGFTATPWRMGQGKITEPYENRNGKITDPLFTHICFDITDMESFNRLIAEGYLAPLVPRRTETVIDTETLHIRSGDFIPGEVELLMDSQGITRRAIEEAVDTCSDRHHWLTFCAGIKSAIDTAEIMTDMGVPTVAIHSKMSTTERRDAIAGYKSGYYKGATNNGVLTTGFDFPAIDLILMLRPSQSTVLWVQMLGRGTRPLFAPGFNIGTIDGRLEAIAASQKQNCLVLDYAGNSRTLGPINDPVLPRARGKGTGTAPIKECPVCSSWVHASVRQCTGVLSSGDKCTHTFDFDTKLEQSAGTHDIIRGELPVVEVFRVDTVQYSRHTKHDRPDSMRVSYFCGMRVFNEYISLQHQGFASKKARDWWRERSDKTAPQTTDDALKRTWELKLPTHLRVWINKKYPEIMSYCYDGTAWGTLTTPVDQPTVMTQGQQKDDEFSVPVDDDIPF